MQTQPQVEYPTDLTAPGAIDQLIAWHRLTFGGVVMEDDGDKGGDDDGDKGGDGGSGDGGDDGDKNDLGFPKDTPVSDMNAEQRAAYFQHKAGKEESRRKGLSRAVGGKTAEQIQADMAELEELRKGKRSEGENAIEEAKATVRKEERARAAEKLALSTLRSALGHIEDKKERDDLIEGIKLERYIDDDGEVDEDRLRDFAKKLAPGGTPTTPKKRNFGAGDRTGAFGKSSGDGKKSSEGADQRPRTWGR